MGRFAHIAMGAALLCSCSDETDAGTVRACEGWDELQVRGGSDTQAAQRLGELADLAEGDVEDRMRIAADALTDDRLTETEVQLTLVKVITACSDVP